MRPFSSRRRRKRPDDFSANVNTFGFIDPSEIVAGRIASSADSDWFRVQLDSGKEYTFFVDGASPLDTVLRLRDTTGRELLFNDDRDPSTTDSQLVFSPDIAGTYYLDVQGLQGSRGSYSLGVQSLEPLDPSDPSLNFNIDLQYSGDPKYQPFFDRAALRWTRIITGDLPDFGGIDDLFINITVESIDGEGDTLGEAIFDALRPVELGGLPYLGTVALDSADLQLVLNEGSLPDVVTHEIGHVLGIGTLWSSKQLLRESRYTGANSVREYQKLGGVETSVPLETSGGQSTELSHWSESVFGTELMTGFFSPGSNPLSSITIGSLQDLGYSVDYTFADRYSIPQNVRSSLISRDTSRLTSASQVGIPFSLTSLSDPLTNNSTTCRCGTCLSIQRTIAAGSTYSEPALKFSPKSRALLPSTILDAETMKSLYSDQLLPKTSYFNDLAPPLFSDTTSREASLVDLY